MPATHILLGLEFPVYTDFFLRLETFFFLDEKLFCEMGGHRDSLSNWKSCPLAVVGMERGVGCQSQVGVLQ